MIQAILRLYSYLFHLLLALFCTGVGTVALLSANTTFETDFFPWSGRVLAQWLLFLGITGILSLVLAVRGKFRFVYLFCAVSATFLVTRGIFASGFRFDGESEFKWALFFWSGVLGANIGALSRFLQPLGGAKR